MYPAWWNHAWSPGFSSAAAVTDVPLLASKPHTLAYRPCFAFDSWATAHPADQFVTGNAMPLTEFLGMTDFNRIR
jgi:hypothetical protein